MAFAGRTLVLPDQETLIRTEPPMSEGEFFGFCAANRKLRIERTAQGEIVVMRPAGSEHFYRTVSDRCRRQLLNRVMAKEFLRGLHREPGSDFQVTGKVTRLE